jgi:PKD domain-containing protein
VVPPGQFQLLTRDGVVFFNDPNTEKAGVVRLDGGIRNAAKYDPKDPNKGLDAPPDTKTPSAPPSSRPQTPPPTNPSRPPATQQPIQPTVPNQPANPNQPTEPGRPTQPTQPTSTQPPPPANPKPKLGIKVSKANPVAGESITLEVTNSTGGIASAHWNFGDGKTGTGTQPTHVWAGAGTFQVSVQVSATDGQQASTSLSVTVQAKPKPMHLLHLNISGLGTVSGGPVNCSVTCDVMVDEGSEFFVNFTPNPGYMVKSAEPCDSQHGGGGGGDCLITVNADRTLTVEFVRTATLTITVADWPTPPSGLITGGGMDCGSTCSITVEWGQPVTLTANNTPDELFGEWTNCPDGSQYGKRVCTYPMNGNYSDTANYYPNIH